MSVIRAAVGIFGRPASLSHKPHSRIAGSRRPSTDECRPYDRPCPSAERISSGRPHMFRAVSTTVEMPCVKLLAPHSTTRFGALPLLSTISTAHVCLQCHET